MRIDVTKMLFIGVQQEKDAFFKKAQQVGLIHFIDLHKGKGLEFPVEIQNITNAIKILRGLPVVRKESPQDLSLADSIAEKIVKLKEAIDNHNEEIRLINLEISRISVFGDFSIEDIAWLKKEGKRYIQFFFSKEAVVPDTELPEEVFYVGTERGLDYFVAINEQPKTYEKMTEMHFEHSLGELKEQRFNARKALHVTEQEIKTYAKYNTFLHHALIAKLNVYNLETAQTFAHEELSNTLFAVEGWVPTNKVAEVQKFVEKFDVYAEEVAIEPEETIPTYLENTGTARIGEDLVHIYDTPSFRDKDPSLWVLYFFALFFAMIVNDAGYGMVYLVIGLYLHYRFPHAKGLAKRLLSLVKILSIFCIVWGILVNSYFGINLPINSPLRKVSILQWMMEKDVGYHMAHKDSTYQEWLKHFPQIAQANTPREAIQASTVTAHGTNFEFVHMMERQILMEMALLMGVIHLVLSLLRYEKKHWSGVGWALFLIGAYLYLPSYLKVTSIIHFAFGIPVETGALVGYWLLICGISLAFLLSVLQHKWDGIAEMAHIVQIFADVMSYLRLYALGLAGAVVAITINDLSGSLPFFMGVILVILAHGINMVLGVGNGIIHGLRLNFLEWYRYSFEGGGKMFRPLHLHDIE